MKARMNVRCISWPLTISLLLLGFTTFLLVYIHAKPEHFIDVIDDTLHKLPDLANFKCSPSCCQESEYSCNSGCVCLDKETKTLLQTRGGNRPDGEF